MSRVGSDYSKLERSDVKSSFMTQELTLVPGQDNHFAFIIRPSRIQLTTGAGFSVIIPEFLSPAVANMEDPEEYKGNNWGPDIESDDVAAGVSSSSSSGGCEAGFGGLMVLGLAVVVLRKR